MRTEGEEGSERGNTTSLIGLSEASEFGVCGEQGYGVVFFFLF